MAPTVDFGPVQYGCTKYKRRMVLYESVNHPGKRFEFCYSSSYQDKRGIETAYYKCVGCMHAKRYNDGRRIPKIAVREGRLVNSNPDRPSNFPHFCQPIDSIISDRRQRERETGTQPTQNHQQNVPIAPQQQLAQPPLHQPINFPSANTPALPTTTTPPAAAVFLMNSPTKPAAMNPLSMFPPGIAANPPMPTQQIVPMHAAAVQQQIQQLAANCFVTSPQNTANSQQQHQHHLLLGMAAAAAWPNAQQQSAAQMHGGGGGRIG